MPNFQLTESLAVVIAEICNRLDGLPLAIELAAARIRLLPPPVLLERLTNALQSRLKLLTGGLQELPARQQTLRSAIAWSYDLLTSAEQSIFRQLAVFVGGCTFEAIEAVIRDQRPENGDQRLFQLPVSSSILDGIESLLDKNLLRQQDTLGAQPSAEPRFAMLETIREYAWELLAAPELPERAHAQAAQQRHADFFLALAETAAPKLDGHHQIAWLDRLELEHDNIRAALVWLEQGGETSNALRLALALCYFWRVRGYPRAKAANACCTSSPALSALRQTRCAPARSTSLAIYSGCRGIRALHLVA